MKKRSVSVGIHCLIQSILPRMATPTPLLLHTYLPLPLLSPNTHPPAPRTMYVLLVSTKEPRTHAWSQRKGRGKGKIPSPLQVTQPQVRILKNMACDWSHSQDPSRHFYMPRYTSTLITFSTFSVDSIPDKGLQGLIQKKYKNHKIRSIKETRMGRAEGAST